MLFKHRICKKRFIRKDFSKVCTPKVCLSPELISSSNFANEIIINSSILVSIGLLVGIVSFYCVFFSNNFIKKDFNFKSLWITSSELRPSIERILEKNLSEINKLRKISGSALEVPHKFLANHNWAVVSDPHVDLNSIIFYPNQNTEKLFSLASDKLEARKTAVFEQLTEKQTTERNLDIEVKPSREINESTIIEPATEKKIVAANSNSKSYLKAKKKNSHKLVAAFHRSSHSKIQTTINEKANKFWNQELDQEIKNYEQDLQDLKKIESNSGENINSNELIVHNGFKIEDPNLLPVTAPENQNSNSMVALANQNPIKINNSDINKQLTESTEYSEEEKDFLLASQDDLNEQLAEKNENSLENDVANRQPSELALAQKTAEYSPAEIDKKSLVVNNQNTATQAIQENDPNDPKTIKEYIDSLNNTSPNSLAEKDSITSGDIKLSSEQMNAPINTQMDTQINTPVETKVNTQMSTLSSTHLKSEKKAENPKADELVFYDFSKQISSANKKVEGSSAPVNTNGNDKRNPMDQASATKNEISPTVESVINDALNRKYASRNTSIPVDINGLEPYSVNKGKRTMNMNSILNNQKNTNLANGDEPDYYDLLNNMHEKNSTANQDENNDQDAYGSSSSRSDDSDPNLNALNSVSKDLGSTGPNLINLENSVVRLRATSVEIGGRGIGEELRDFEFRPNYSSEQVYSDNGEGEILLNNNLNYPLNIMAGSLGRGDKVLTNIDIILEKGSYTYQVPLIDSESFGKFLDKYNLQARGGFVLVDVDDQTQDVDTDSYYEAKFYFDKEFHLVNNKVAKDEKTGANNNKERKFRYVLLVGVKPGNCILKYTISNDRIINRIAFVQEDEIFFDMNTYLGKDADNFSLYENNIFGSKKARLNLSPNQIHFFNENRKVRKLGFNRYEINSTVIPMGQRIYMEIRYPHQDNILVVGKGENDQLLVPSIDYMNEILHRKGIQDLRGGCLVQINLSRPMKRQDPYSLDKSFMVEGKFPEGIMNLDTIFLNKKGNFSPEGSETSDKIFITGENPGVINARIDYQDGTRDYIQTYCSEDTYLVEQL